MNAPVLTIRSTTTPFAVISPLTFSQTAPSGSPIPVLAGEKSDKEDFRIYNNYALQSSIAAAFNVEVTTYDGSGSGSHTAIKSVVGEKWLKLYQYGYGESAGVPGIFSYWQSTEVAVGGSSDYFQQDKSSNGVAGNEIRAGVSGNGVGFLELRGYLEVPITAQPGDITFSLSMLYEWLP